MLSNHRDAVQHAKSQINRKGGIDELLSALRHIGMRKNDLPSELRGWVNALGLYVQTGLVFPSTGAQEYIAAGGKFRKYFYAICHYTLNGDQDSEIMVATMTGDFGHWKVKKFDRKVWEKRFAYLVEPTCEIAWYLAEPQGQSLPKLTDVVNHFKSTGEWLGLYDNRCVSCGQGVSWWKYFCCGPCPHCGEKIRD